MSRLLTFFKIIIKPRISQAYEILSNEDRRKLYDTTGSVHLSENLKTFFYVVFHLFLMFFLFHVDFCLFFKIIFQQIEEVDAMDFETLVAHYRNMWEEVTPEKVAHAHVTYPGNVSHHNSQCHIIIF